MIKGEGKSNGLYLVEALVAKGIGMFFYTILLVSSHAGMTLL